MHIDTPLLLPTETGLPVQRKVFTRVAADFLAKHYPALITAFGIVIILLQFIEHRSPLDQSVAFFYGEIILLVGLLSCAIFLARKLLDSLYEKSRLLHNLELKHEIGMDLSSSQDIEEACKRLNLQIAWISPAAEAKLYLYEKNKNRFMAADGQSGSERSLAALDAAPCRQCFAFKTHKLQPLSPCPHKEGSFLTDGYCLPLGRGSWPVGLLLLHPPFPQDLNGHEIDLLENISPEISSSLFSVIEKKARVEDTLDRKIRDVHLDIARDLHDTLAQNISYLRMKLEYLAEPNMQDKANLPAEIGHLSEIANESYDQVRGSLSVLQSASDTDLLHLFTRYADQIAERSGFTIDFTCRGEPQSLCPNQARQLFMIFREAISNIEKHAKASQVEVEMAWKEDGLSLSVADNGCGFDQPLIPTHFQSGEHPSGHTGGHYGLQFIAERTRVMKGSFSAHSALGCGTKLAIQVPYE